MWKFSAEAWQCCGPRGAGYPWPEPCTGRQYARRLGAPPNMFTLHAAEGYEFNVFTRHAAKEARSFAGMYCFALPALLPLLPKHAHRCPPRVYRHHISPPALATANLVGNTGMVCSTRHSHHIGVNPRQQAHFIHTHIEGHTPGPGPSSVASLTASRPRPISSPCRGTGT